MTLLVVAYTRTRPRGMVRLVRLCWALHLRRLASACLSRIHVDMRTCGGEWQEITRIIEAAK